ncbi:MAG: methylmalonyl-CoA mutase family protein, partial [Acidimicrobiia bacterium]|nr:methylmalonyl-CoA mutase family protein [Acidimicrobiia bacterium]
GEPGATSGRRSSTWSAAGDHATGETMSGVPFDSRQGSDDGEFGQYPYTRGPYASMYRSKLWTMRMFAGFGTAGGHQPALPASCSRPAAPACPPPSTCPR